MAEEKLSDVNIASQIRITKRVLSKIKKYLLESLSFDEIEDQLRSCIARLYQTYTENTISDELYRPIKYIWTPLDRWALQILCLNYALSNEQEDTAVRDLKRCEENFDKLSDLKQKVLYRLNNHFHLILLSISKHEYNKALGDMIHELDREHLDYLIECIEFMQNPTTSDKFDYIIMLDMWDFA